MIVKENYLFSSKEILLYLLCCLFCISCSNLKETEKKTQEQQKVAEKKTTNSNIPKAEKGITIVNKNGWTKDQRDFQQRYCETMFEQVEGYDSYKFCNCFLEKVQYYYEPIYIREAYDDQKKWNSECLEEAQM